MKAVVVVVAFNQEKALVGAFSVITNLRMQFGCNFLNHVSWDLGAAGTMLLGGGYDGGGDTAEIVRPDDTVEGSYDLKYDTR